MVEPDQIMAVLEEAARPLLAREIVEVLAKRGARGIDKSSVNQCLYGALKERVGHDKRFCWFAITAPKNHPKPSSSEPERPAAPAVGLNYPVAEYYRDRVREGVTLSRGGQWWSAALLIEDPRTEKKFVSLYLWEMVQGTWKKRKSFPIRSRKSLRALRDVLVNFEQHLP